LKNNLKALRQEQSLTQEELASILGVSRQTINSIETGKFDPSLKLVIKIARFFKTELESIFIFEENA